MSPTRLIILGVGFIAAIAAAFLAVNLSSTAPETIKQIVKIPTIQTTKILAASKSLLRGQVVKSGDLAWLEWPSSSISDRHFTKKKNPNILKKLIGRTVRFSMEKGDPAGKGKFVAEGRGFMASVLTSGKRAVSTRVSPGTAAGGFILPDDRVDVMMTRAIGPEDNQSFKTEPVLRNVRVLAIDQVIQEKDGQSVVVGKTATLELDDDQVRILTVTQQIADQITLALRSLRDAKEPVTSEGLYLVGEGPASEKPVSIVRYGKRSIIQAK